jgi:hypothetical protein
MTCNVGGIERPIRILLGVLVLGIGVFSNLPLIGTAIALTLGSIALVTGVIGYCPLWTLFGLNTCQSPMSQKGRPT